MVAGDFASNPRVPGRRRWPAVFIGWLVGWLVIGLGWSTVAHADEDLDAKLRPETGQAVAPALTTLTQEAKRALVTIEKTTIGADIEADEARITILLSAYRLSVDHAIDRTFGRSRLKRVEDRLSVLVETIWTDLERVSASVDQVRAVEATWKAHRAHWKSLRRTLAKDSTFSELGPEVERGIKVIDEVLDPLPDIVPVRVAQQQQLLDLSQQAQALQDRIDRELEEGNIWSWSRTHAPMYTREFWERAEPTAIIPIESTESFGQFAIRTFRTLVIHVLLFIVLAIVARSLRVSRLRGEFPLSVLEHPLALALLLSTTAVAALYGAAPPGVEVILIVVFAISAIQIARGALPDRRARIGAVALALTYPALLACDLLGLPDSVMRGLVLIASLGLAVTSLWLTRSASGWLIHIGRWLATAFAIVALCEFFGLVALARYLLTALFDTALALLIVLAVINFLRQFSDAIVAPPRARPQSPWRQILSIVVLRFGRLFELFAVLVGILVVLSEWEILPSARETTRIILEVQIKILGVEISAARILGAVLTLYIARQVARVFEVLLELALFRSGSWDEGLASSIRTLVRYSTVAIGALVALGVLGIDASSLTIIAGALGVGLGFGLQNIVSDFVSGLLLLFERPLRKGDSLVIADTWGVVKHIGLRSTLITLIDESELVVPNGHLTSEKIRNWTLTSQSARIFCSVGVAYGSDLHQVFAALQDVATKDEDVLGHPAPEVLFLGFGDSSLDVELRVWVQQVQLRYQIRSRLLCAIDARFREDKIEISFPQRDLHLRSLPSSVVSALGPPPPSDPPAPSTPSSDSPEPKESATR